MRSIRQDPALIAGIGLPLLLVILFSVASLLPQWMVRTPRYDLYYVVNAGTAYKKTVSGELDIKVVNGKIKAQYRVLDQKPMYRTPRLYVFHARTLTSEEIPLDLSVENFPQWQEIPIPAPYNKAHIQPGTTSPDGYSFVDERSASREWFLFFRLMNNHASIKKDGRSISLQPNRDDLFIRNIDILGWGLTENEP